MFEYKEKLKKLPIPELEESMERYKKLVEPLLSKKEFENTCKAVDSFLKKDSIAFDLHKTLLEKCSKEDSQSWLVDLWNKMYLEYRDEIAININYYAILDNSNFKTKFTHSQILAIAICEMAKLYFSIIDESMPAEIKKDVPYCMENYENIFAACRIPDYKIDRHVVKEKSKKMNHIIFMYKSNMYKIFVSNKDGKIHSANKIANTIDYIISTAEKFDENIGTLTSSKRDFGADVYDKLMGIEENRKNFDDINNSIAVFCLDGKNNEDITCPFLLSNGANRYFDKSTQFILTDDKNLGINNEHSHADASLYNVVMEKLYEALSVEKNLFNVTDLTKVNYKQLYWELNSEIENLLKFALNNHRKKANYVFTKKASFNSFGKNSIKKLGISPDAFFHLSLQLAEYRTFGELKSTYEAISMRDYRQGRTECARPLNMDSKNFAESFDKLFYDIHKKEEIIDLFNKAVNTHSQNLKSIKNGEGVERYLFALEKMNTLYIKDDKAFEFFNDESYRKLKYDFISTSNFGAEHIKAFGFANVAYDGYGIGYSVNKDNIALTISSHIDNKEKAEELILNLHKAFENIYISLL